MKYSVQIIEKQINEIIPCNSKRDAERILEGLNHYQFKAEIVESE